MSSTPPPSEPEASEPTAPEATTPEETKPLKQSAILQPKMQQKISLRYAISLLAVAALLFGWYFLKNYLVDIDTGSTDTTGWISAIKQTASGQQVVVIKPDGSIMESPDFRDGAEDRDNVWQPDGERVFFTSDRDQSMKGYHVFRWNVANNSVTQRSIGTRAQEHPTYSVDSDQTPPFTQLLVSGGVVVEFDPRTTAAHQVIPSEGKTPTQGEEGGNNSQFGPEYEHLGTSYREAYWCKNRKYIVGIMRRNDTETLVVQCMQASKSDNPLEDGAPHGIIAGDHIDLTIDPKTGNIVYAVVNLQLVDPDHAPPEMIKNGKIVMETRNMIGFMNPDNLKETGRVVAWNTAERVFTQPRVSPDGSKVAFIGGVDAGGTSKPIGLFVCPLIVAGGGSMTQLAAGAASSPSWAPDGKTIVFSGLEPTGTSDIISVDATVGGSAKILTQGKGSFSSPAFSPMQPKSRP